MRVFQQIGQHAVEMPFVGKDMQGLLRQIKVEIFSGFLVFREELVIGADGIIQRKPFLFRLWHFGKIGKSGGDAR